MRSIMYKRMLAAAFSLFFSAVLIAQDSFKEFRGVVEDAKSGKSLEFVNLSVEATNISTVTNADGEFLIKIPAESLNHILLVSFLGYDTKQVPINSLKAEGNTIELMPSVTQLSEVSISAFKNPQALVRRVFKNKAKNNHDNSVLMTAFYRETIKKRRRNVSLTEAVVNLHKRSYTSGGRDVMEIRKARKQTDYKRLDTLSVKMQGGPFTNIYADIMKYPEYIFALESIDDYKYSFAESSSINGRPVYVVNFELIDKSEVGFYGKLFIDVESIALVSADYALDVSDRRKTKNLLVRKKPSDVVVYPTKATYHVDYVEKNGRWYYNYSSVDLSFKINKKRQLFNAVYTMSSEMAITNWQPTANKSSIDNKNRLKPSVIIADEVSGFSDPDFWGAYNLIEPEKSIESAIKKIRRKLDRSSKSGTSKP